MVATSEDDELIIMKSHGILHVNLRLLLISSVTCFLLTTSLITWAGFFGVTEMDEFGGMFVSRETMLDRDASFIPQYNGTLPFNVWVALQNRDTTGYLVGNSTILTFHPYPYEVDVRVIVLAYNRAQSLNECLHGLNSVDFEMDRVSIEIWIDRDPNNSIHVETYTIAKMFNFTDGDVRVRVQPRHVGVQGQWTNTWRPRIGTREIAVFVEDDMDVSPYFWRWLKRAHVAYANRNDVSGFGLSHPGLAHQYGGAIQLHPQKTIYMYKVITTWGFSPEVNSWRAYQDWFYDVEQNATFQPLVPGILPTDWWLGEKKLGRERNLWEMWHIYYTHQKGQYTVLLNSLADGLLAVNRHEYGLHDGKYASGATEKLCERWHESYVIFPKDPAKIGYDGIEEDLEYS